MGPPICLTTAKKDTNKNSDVSGKENTHLTFKQLTKQPEK